MQVLGINAYNSDTSSAILENGELIAAVEEEREPVEGVVEADDRDQERRDVHLFERALVATAPRRRRGAHRPAADLGVAAAAPGHGEHVDEDGHEPVARRKTETP